MLDRHEVEKYLARIGDIRRSHPLHDIHAHPFELLFNDLIYQKSPDFEDLYSTRPAGYLPPRAVGIRSAVPAADTCRVVVKEAMKEKCLQFAMGQLYLHTGPRVFADHMDLSGIDSVLLLPVMGPGLACDDQMALMTEMFGHDARFVFGYCLPNGVETGQIDEVVRDVVRQYRVRAIKIHPAVTGIDVGASEGLERVEAILRACRDHDLSVVIHGGKSPAVRTVETRSYGELVHLQEVDWSLSGNPVVIAHAGAYGCDREDLLQTVFPQLSRIMAKHDNVLVDVSGIDFNALCLLLRTIDPDRAVFGSDCLYYPQWKTLVSLYHACQQSVARPEESFIKIASCNPMMIMSMDEPAEQQSFVS